MSGFEGVGVRNGHRDSGYDYKNMARGIALW